MGDMLVSVICAGLACSRRSDSGARAKNKANERAGKKEGIVRRSMEARLIFRHKTLQPNGMNIDFAFL